MLQFGKLSLRVMEVADVLVIVISFNWAAMEKTNPLLYSCAVAIEEEIKLH
jgi:hypothetical protein